MLLAGIILAGLTSGSPVAQLVAELPTPVDAQEVRRDPPSATALGHIRFLLHVEPASASPAEAYYSPILETMGWERCSSNAEHWRAGIDGTVTPPTRLYVRVTTWMAKNRDRLLIVGATVTSPLGVDLSSISGTEQAVEVILDDSPASIRSQVQQRHLSCGP